MSVVISLSSVVIEDKILLNNFAENLETLSNSSIKSTIVHDYKNLVESHLDFLGAKKNRYSELGNYGISDLYEMIICGHINKRVVSKLCSFGLQALSFSGKDGNLIVAGGEARSVANAKDLSIGEPAIINPEILFELEETKIIPVISPIACNKKGYTTILDTGYTAAMIASAINASRLIIMCEDDFLINQVGMLSSFNELNKLLENTLEITANDPLIKAAKYILLNSEISVHFIDARKNNSLLLSIFD